MKPTVLKLEVQGQDVAGSDLLRSRGTSKSASLVQEGSTFVTYLPPKDPPLPKIVTLGVRLQHMTFRNIGIQTSDPQLTRKLLYHINTLSPSLSLNLGPLCSFWE
jgi:hypothetical protein